MKIVDIQTCRLNPSGKVSDEKASTTSPTISWRENIAKRSHSTRGGNEKQSSIKTRRYGWNLWNEVWCKVTLEDGTWGLGSTEHGRPVAAIIEDLFAPNLIGEDGLDIETLSDRMWSLTKHYGSHGFTSNAVSAVDLALWDAKGRLLKVPVYSLIGGPHHEKLYGYATGNDLDWYQELNFTAFKLPCPYGYSDGMEGIYKNEEFVARAREKVGDECELMLDCYMTNDVDHSVLLAEQLRPYNIKWIEECLVPDDFDAHLELRRRMPWQVLASGEHWYTHMPFEWALRNDAVDILQPDIHWAGGMTTCIKIFNAAQEAGKQVILHLGAYTVYGQHFIYGMPGVNWAEYWIDSAPGTPLIDDVFVPGQAVALNGWIEPNDAPGFGHEIPEEWLEPFS